MSLNNYEIELINNYINLYGSNITLFKLNENNIYCVLENISNCINTNLMYISTNNLCYRKDDGEKCIP